MHPGLECILVHLMGVHYTWEKRCIFGRNEEVQMADTRVGGAVQEVQ